MKVLVVHNRYLSRHVGGEDIVYHSEVDALRRRLGAESVLTYDVSNDDISKWKLLFTIWFSWTHYRAINELVRRHSIDVVHVHNFFPILTPSVFLAAKAAGAKVIHTLHNFRWWCIAGIFYREEVGACELCATKTFPLSGVKYRCYRGSALQSALAQVAFSAYKLMGYWRHVDRFIVLTDFQRQKVLKLGIPEDRVALKPHGIKALSASGSSKNGYIFVGRIESAKGIQRLLSAWKELGSEYQLTVVGEGDAPAHGENVKFVGKQDHGTTLRMIASSKYLIHTSLVYETFGLTILEAMSLGTPVIGFNIGTRPEFVRDGVTGFLCEPEQLASTVIRSAHHEDYSALSSHAREMARDFAEDIMVNRLISVYES